ncbi:hypothetical protein IscW_ISCW009632 [Ixodes scapularis]|uniref:Uncharacterized protein n=1 Tax=Ixodes scapularis TaxID=6945 RepID=B7PXH8_IXOSC|nr:hypothetical protein IscW_ISCW009632 [Ixodes scapularis]|eukprot:XP_002400894.1 hypothetical protein IscW_ISCW009632 [Ixodes scapularis]
MYECPCHSGIYCTPKASTGPTLISTGNQTAVPGLHLPGSAVNLAALADVGQPVIQVSP